MDGATKYMDGALFRFKISFQTEKTIIRELINICLSVHLYNICFIKYAIE